jgi:hypothetical protein
MIKQLTLLWLLTGSMAVQAEEVTASETAKIKSNVINKYTKFQTVNLSNNDMGSFLKGKIRQRELGPSTQHGHIDIQLIDEKSKIVEIVPVAYSPQRLSKKRYFASKFSYQFKKTLPETWTVTLRFHPSEINNHIHDNT